MRQDHASAAVASQTKAVQGNALNGLLGLVLTRSSVIVLSASRINASLLVSLDELDEVDVLIVLVANDLKTFHDQSDLSFQVIFDSWLHLLCRR